jgi:hypothetical protein
MNRSTARWTTALAAATLLALPSGAWAQTTAAQPPAPSANQDAQATSPQDHLKMAEAALNGIPATAVTGRSKTRMTELKQHLSALQRAAAANDNASAMGAARRSSTATKDARGNTAWATEAAAIDRILTEMLGPGTTAGATEPGATGTSGTSAAPALDDETRAKLMEVRSHVTAFAASISGAGSAPSAAAQSTTPAEPPTSATQPPTSATQPPTSASQPPTSSTSSTQPPTGTQAPTSAQAPASASTPQADEEAAKRHLTAARDTLSQLTQLPAATQLSGDARTQVSQLITNFNELITTSANWHDAYAKVDANVTALIGAQTTDESTAAATAGTAGAVGTSGSATGSLDPTIRAKLVEFRSHLREFEKAAGGASAPAASNTSAAGAATSGQAGAGTSAAGTTASSSAAGEQSQAAAKQPASSDEAMRHIEAIEAILNGNSAGASGAGTAGTTGSGTSGTTGTSGAGAASGLMLERAQLEQLRMHLAELRRLLNQK